MEFDTIMESEAGSTPTHRQADVTSFSDENESGTTGNESKTGTVFLVSNLRA